MVEWVQKKEAWIAIWHALPLGWKSALLAGSLAIVAMVLMAWRADETDD